jgi:hypothetical protein
MNLIQTTPGAYKSFTNCYSEVDSQFKVQSTLVSQILYECKVSSEWAKPTNNFTKEQTSIGTKSLPNTELKFETNFCYRPTLTHSPFYCVQNACHKTMSPIHQAITAILTYKNKAQQANTHTHPTSETYLQAHTGNTG